MCGTGFIWNSHLILTEAWECVGLAPYGTVITTGRGCVCGQKNLGGLLVIQTMEGVRLFFQTSIINMFPSAK